MANQHKLRVLFILHVPPPVNGAAVMGQRIIESQEINKTFEVDYINLATSFSLDTIGKGGLAKIKAVLNILSQVYKALRTKDYDLCYLTLTAKDAGFYKDALVVALLKTFGTKIIYHFHNKGVKANSNSFLKRALYRFVFNKTQSIQLSSLLYYDIKDYVAPSQVYFCPNGIPDENPNVGKALFRDSACNFLFLSNMMEEKGVLILIEACKILKDQGKEFTCHFVGAWSDVSQDTFNNKISRLGLQDCIYAHGKQYGVDKIQFFERADVFVFPTFYHNECFPLVLLEGMQYGLPIISTNEGGIGDIVKEGTTGYIVKQRESSSLAQAMSLCIDNPSLRQKMGTASRERYEKVFTFQVFENNLTHILTQAIAKEN